LRRREEANGLEVLETEDMAALLGGGRRNTGGWGGPATAARRRREGDRLGSGKL
jgi:hypothetical protein